MLQLSGAWLCGLYSVPQGSGLSRLRSSTRPPSMPMPPRGSVIHIRCRPRIFGLCRHNASAVADKLIDGGANICVTGDLSTLVIIEEIPPMPISVAIAGDDISSDDCCTKRGYTPLTLDDANLYWQLHYYCANVVETMISPQAVIAKSNVFTSWTQTYGSIVPTDSSRCPYAWTMSTASTTARPICTLSIPFVNCASTALPSQHHHPTFGNPRATARLQRVNNSNRNFGSFA